MTPSLEQQVLDALGDVLRAKERLTISQWADRFRILARGVSAKSMHGDRRYQTSDAPHQREVQESFTDPTVQTTVLCMASQISGKSEMINNAIGFHMHLLPTSAIVMYPTVESAERFSKRKFAPMVQATPVLVGLMATAKARSPNNTILSKDFSGGSVFFVGANSPASLRGASGQLLIGDEIDSYEESAGTEGDPIELLWKRGESFPNCTKILASTPTIKYISRIWSWFEASDQRYWTMKCVHCDQPIKFLWPMVRWPKDNPAEAVIECSKCAGIITDKQRLDMYFAGYWEASAPFNGVRGYHLNWLHCPWPPQKGYRHRLHQFATEWTRASRKGSQSLKVLINTGLCECFEEQMEEAPPWEQLYRRRETYPADHLPEPVCYITCTVDTQRDRLELEWVGWAVDEESYGLGFKRLFGSPHQPKVWADLAEELNRSWVHPCGATLKLGCCLIDSGGATDAQAFAQPVYRFCRRRQQSYIFACKGSSEIGSPLVLGRMQKNGVMLQMVGTDQAKSTVYERLKLLEPGPGYCHWPEGMGYDEEYFKGLTAERIFIDRDRGSMKRKWIKNRSRNEPLDLRGYHLAALEIRNCNLPAIAENIRAAAKAKNPPSPVPPLVSPHVSALAPATMRPRPRPLRRRVGFVGGWNM